MEVVEEVKKHFVLQNIPFLPLNLEKEVLFFWKGEEFSGKEGGNHCHSIILQTEFALFGLSFQRRRTPGHFLCQRPMLAMHGVGERFASQSLHGTYSTRDADRTGQEANPPLPENVGPIKKFKLMSEVEVECLIIGGSGRAFGRN